MLDKLIILTPSVCTAMYAIASVAFALKRDWSWSTVYAGYTLANIGLIIASTR